MKRFSEYVRHELDPLCCIPRYSPFCDYLNEANYGALSKDKRIKEVL